MEFISFIQANLLLCIFIAGLTCSLFEYLFPIVRQPSFFRRKNALSDVLIILINLVIPKLGLQFVLFLFYFFGYKFFNLLLQKLNFTSIHISNLFLQFIVLFLINELFTYILHRYIHNSDFLFVHHLHHSSPQIDWLAGLRGHWLEDIMLSAFTMIPMSFFTVDDSVLKILFFIGFIGSHLNHMNVNFHLGPLTKWIANPKVHRWHHSTKNYYKGGQNFGSCLLVWDHVFGTFYMPDDLSVPEKFGIPGKNNYPTTLIDQLYLPIVYLYKRIILKRFKRMASSFNKFRALIKND